MAGQSSIENGKLGGRPKGAVSLETKRKQAFEKLLFQSINKEKKAIIDAAITKAKNGDAKIIIDLLNRTVGKPIDRIDHTTKGEQMDFVVVSYGKEDPINNINKEDGVNDSVSIPSKETPGGVSEQSS